jgi:hypothetical protein
MQRERQPVFIARGLTKTYHSGEVVVQALREVVNDGGFNLVEIHPHKLRPSRLTW